MFKSDIFGVRFRHFFIFSLQMLKTKINHILSYRWTSNNIPCVFTDRVLYNLDRTIPQSTRFAIKFMYIRTFLWFPSKASLKQEQHFHNKSDSSELLLIWIWYSSSSMQKHTSVYAERSIFAYAITSRCKLPQ